MSDTKTDWHLLTLQGNRIAAQDRVHKAERRVACLVRAGSLDLVGMQQQLGDADEQLRLDTEALEDYKERHSSPPQETPKR